MIFSLILALVLIGIAAESRDRDRPSLITEVKAELMDNPAPATRGPIIIDLHADTLTQLYKGKSVALINGQALEITLPRMKQGGVKGQVFAVWAPPNQGWAYAQELIKIFQEMLAQNPADLAPAKSAADFERNLNAGKISAFLGLEGGHAIGDDLAKVDELHRQGVIYITLTWNNSNLIADAAKDQNQPHHGLSPFGKKVVQRMNQLGMLIDVSHASKETVSDVLALSESPVIASHSDCAAVYPNPRNLDDGQIKAICGPGGVIGVNFHSAFLSPKKTATLSDVADHVDHLKKIGGLDCIALGSDFDGEIIAPAGLENASRFENLLSELTRRGYSSADLDQICYLNFLRVLRRAADAKIK